MARSQAKADHIREGSEEMPIYEFDCLKCGREFKLVLSLREYEKKNVSCPRCKSKKVEQFVTSCEVVTSRKS
jgi:putative FmdB family regulatory protein